MRNMHRLLMVGCLFPTVAKAAPTPNNTSTAMKANIGIVEAAEKEKVISASDAFAKDGKAAVAPAIGVVHVETPEKVKDEAKSNQKAPESSKAGNQKVTDTESTPAKKDDKSRSIANRPNASQVASNTVHSPVINGTKAGAAPATTATANTTQAAVTKATSVLPHDLTFWEILVIWNSELIHCIPIVLIAYSLLSLAVHYPSIVDSIAHWYQVRTTTMQKGILSGKRIYMGRSMPAAPGYAELDHGLDSGRYGAFSTSMNLSSSNQFAL